MLVSDRRRLRGMTLPGLAREAAEAGVAVIQVREKDLDDRALRGLVADVVAAVSGSGARVVVNGRPDVAVASGAAGVQLPERGLGVADVKRGFPGLLVGASRHSAAGAARAEAEGADWIVLGPVFPTPGKPESLGVAGLREACAALQVPVFAIGGIETGTAALAAAAGARGLAAIRAFLDPPVREAVLRLRRAGARAVGDAP
jgi:thiamine-phosphate pyrophosphorylase